jgi:2-haloacid dehalogenase
MTADSSAIKALVFDVFGTCTDWRGSVIRELETVGHKKGITADWSAMADEWRREGYIRGIARIRAHETPYVGSDVLFRRKLDELLPKFGVNGLSEPEIADLANAWRRLDPWPDTVPGLQRLKTRFTISPLSNGSFATLTTMAKRAGMPWDCIISTELRETFKPEREAYRLASTLLDVEPDQVMLVAAHQSDLKGAQAAGLHTAHIPRPGEWGPNAEPLPPADPSFDYLASDFVDLARQLGA